MAEESHTAKFIPHLGDEAGEYGHVPTFGVRIGKGGKGKPSTARPICPEWPPADIIGKVGVIDGVPKCPYVSDFADIPHIVNLRRLDLRRLDDAGPVVFEATVAYLPSQSA